MTGGDITPSLLAKFYHGWLRMDWQLTRVQIRTSGQFDPESKKYYTALAVISVLFVFPFILGIFLVLFKVCCRKRHSTHALNQSELVIRKAKQTRNHALVLLTLSM